MRIKDLILSLLFCCICWNVTAQRGGELEGTHNVEIYPQLGHSGTAGASNLKFSPDGKQIISVGSNVILWDVATGRILRTFPGSLATFSPDGKYIITVSHSIYDSTSEIKLWDISSGQEIRIFSGHTWRVDSVSFSPDGRQIISGSGDRTIKLWDVITGREIRTFLGHARGVDSVSFSPDGRQIVSGSIDGIIKLWDAATGREIRTFTGHSSIVNSVMFSSDGRQILSCSQDSNIKLWDANTGREIRTFSGHSLTVRTAMFTPDGRQILSSSYDGTIKIWDVATGRENRTFFEESWHAILSPDGMHILSSIGHIVTLRDISTGIEIKRFTSNATAIEAVAYNTSNKQIVTSANDKIIIWDTINGREIRNFRGPFGNMILSPDGRQILTGSKYFGRGDGSTFTNDVILYDYATGRENKYFSSEYAVGSMIWAIAFNPNSMQIASGRNSARQNHFNNNITLWDAITGQRIRTFSSSGWVYSIAFSPDGKYLLSCFGGNNFYQTESNDIRLWDITTGHEIRAFLGYETNFKSVAFNSDGRQFITGSFDGLVKLWDTATFENIRSFTGHLSSVNTVVFSPDGRQIISGSDDNTIKLWDVASGREVRTFNGHSSSVNSISFIDDGRKILSGSSDGTTRLWDIATGREIAQFISFTDGEWIVITPDGYYNASPNGDKYLNVRVGNNVYG
ncbi:MAG: hypothetical protein FWD28_08710, partial [Treponema sp.]|nr:hypothetical protein [Treponema sp.]